MSSHAASTFRPSSGHMSMRCAFAVWSARATSRRWDSVIV